MDEDTTVVPGTHWRMGFHISCLAWRTSYHSCTLHSTTGGPKWRTRPWNQSKALSLSLVVHLQTSYKGAFCLFPGRRAPLSPSHEGHTTCGTPRTSHAVPTRGKSILHDHFVPLRKSKQEHPSYLLCDSLLFTWGFYPSSSASRSYLCLETCPHFQRGHLPRPSSRPTPALLTHLNPQRRPLAAAC